MKVSATLGFVFCFIMLFGQSDNFAKKFEVGVSFSPEYSYRYMRNKTDEEVYDVLIKLYNEIDKPKFGYSGGVNFVYNISKLLQLQTGVLYSNKGFLAQTGNYVADSTFIPIEPMSLESTWTYSFHTFDIPVLLNVKSGNKKFNFIGGVGVVSNFYFAYKQRLKMTYEDETITQKGSLDKNNFKNFTLSVQASAGLLYNVSQFVNIRVEPTFRAALTGVTKSNVATHFYSFGVNASCFYRF